MSRPKIMNEMKMTFISRSANEAFARTSVAAFVSQLDVTLSQLTEIKTAVSEAVTNSIVHGYADTIGMIYINTIIYENGKVKIKIMDRGCGIDDVEKAMEPLFTTAENEERAGMGFTIMDSFMDSLQVTSKVGNGTTVTMEKYLYKKDRVGSGR